MMNNSIWDMKQEIADYVWEKYETHLPQHLNDDMIVLMYEAVRVSNLEGAPVRVQAWANRFFMGLLSAGEEYAMTIERVQAEAREFRAIQNMYDVDASA